MQHTDSLPPFVFSSGYRLECVDMGDDGLKLTLNHNGEEDRAILLPPEQCTLFLNWQRGRIGKRVTESNPALKTIYEGMKESVQKEMAVIERVMTDIALFYDLIEIDTGVTAEQIQNHKFKPPPIVFARDLLCFILRLRFDLSTPKIAAITGAKDHASTLVSLKKFDKRLLNEQLYKDSDMLKIYEDAKRRHK